MFCSYTIITTFKNYLHKNFKFKNAYNNVYMAIAARDLNSIQHLGKQSVLRSIQFYCRRYIMYTTVGCNRQKTIKLQYHLVIKN